MKPEVRGKRLLGVAVLNVCGCNGLVPARF